MFDPARYPENWHELARQVKEAAGWCCEQCGHRHAPEEGYTLTVHHIDGDTFNSAATNLVALCQRCHLSLHQRQLVGQFWFDFARPDWLQRRQVPAVKAPKVGTHQELKIKHKCKKESWLAPFSKRVCSLSDAPPCNSRHNWL